MNARSLKCVACGAEQAPRVAYACRSCGRSLDVVYDYGEVSAEKLLDSDGEGVWKYAALLPCRTGAEGVTLGEGNTPLTRVSRLSAIVGHGSMYIKNETVNPTLSFKDRAMAVGFTVARLFELGEVVVASTGNTAVSASAYGARSGIAVRLFVPRTVPEEKLKLMKRYGARVTKVAGTFSDAYELAKAYAMRHGAFNLTSTFLNPYGNEGYKTVAYEIYDQLRIVPDWVVVPIGAGPLLVYCHKGFVEMERVGIAVRLPRMVGVQAAGCAPIAKAFQANAVEVRPWRKPRTIATAIADPLTSYPTDGTRTLRLIRNSGGCAISIQERAIYAWIKRLARLEGILAEAGAVLSVAAVHALKRRGMIKPGHKVVAVVTGHGVKHLLS